MKEKREEKKRNSVSYYMDQTKKEMKDIERAVDKQRELKSLFYKECTEIEKYIEKREYQAGIAEEAGETKLANFAKEEVAQYKEQLATTQGHYDSASEQLDTLELKNARDASEMEEPKDTTPSRDSRKECNRNS